LTVDFVELFCGIGGFRLGLEKANQKRELVHSRSNPTRQEAPIHGNATKTKKGDDPSTNSNSKIFRCVWANDNDRSACKIYHHRFGYKELVEADIKTVNANSIPDHTLLTAGFPCQAFSVAGKRKGFRDTRGTLFYEICRVAEAKRPPLLLLENVKGLLSHDEGLTFQIIIESLEELGYLCEWQVLNSKHFGVPQNRERVFIIGHLDGEGGRTIFPIGEVNQSITKTPKKPQGERSRLRVANTLSRRYYKDGSENLIAKSALIQSQGREPHIETRKDGVSHALKGKGGWEGNYLEVQAPKILQLVGDRDKPSVSVKDEAFCLPSNPMSDRQQVVVEHKKKPYIQNVPHGYNEGWKKTLPNLRAEGDSAHNELLVQNCRIRRLTPTECERLQGFPDGWTRGVSDTQRYKLLGNAVTVPVIEFLGRKLLEV